MKVAGECVCCDSQKLERNPAVLMPFVSHRVFGFAPVAVDDTWGWPAPNKWSSF